MDEQPVPRRHRRPGSRRPRRDRAPSTAQRTPVHAGTRPTSGGSEASRFPSRPTASGWEATPTTQAESSTRRSRSSPPRAAAPPAVVTYALPNDLYNMDLADGEPQPPALRPVIVRHHDDAPFRRRLAERSWRLHGERQALHGLERQHAHSGPSTAPTSVRRRRSRSMASRSSHPSGFNIPGTTTRVPALTTDIART